MVQKRFLLKSNCYYVTHFYSNIIYTSKSDFDWKNTG